MKERMNNPFLVMVFQATEDTIKTEKRMQGTFNTTIIPTPREISESCGFAIKLPIAEKELLTSYISGIEVPCKLYYLGKRDSKRERTVLLLKER